MNLRSRRKFCLSAAVAGTVAAIATAFVATPTFASDGWPLKVSANYTIRVAGVKFGAYNFSSSRKGSNYKIQSNAKLRAFLGAFKWRGSASAAGTLTAGGPDPLRYNYSAQRKKKRRKTVAMTLQNRNVTGLKVVPPVNPSRARVPLHAKDKQNILDPMSAIVAMSVPATGDPCRQSVQIFDGKHRFDVHLRPKTKKAIEARSGKGFLRTAHVCKVRYVPISGHKTGKKNLYVIKEKSIEAWMVPTADRRMYMVYRIVVPTALGSVSLQANNIQVELPGNRRIALTN